MDLFNLFLGIVIYTLLVVSITINVLWYVQGFSLDINLKSPRLEGSKNEITKRIDSAEGVSGPSLSPTPSSNPLDAQSSVDSSTGNIDYRNPLDKHRFPEFPKGYVRSKGPNSTGDPNRVTSSETFVRRASESEDVFRIRNPRSTVDYKLSSDMLLGQSDPTSDNYLKIDTSKNM